MGALEPVGGEGGGRLGRIEEWEMLGAPRRDRRYRGSEFLIPRQFLPLRIATAR